MSLFRLMIAVLLVLGPARPASAVATEEVPFITTPDNVTLEMLRLADVGPEDYLIDLGSGDGRIVVVAAQRFGARGLGVELVPDLVMRSIANAHAAGVAERAEFRVQDLFETDLSRATVITLYLLPQVNLALRPSLLSLAPGTRIVSHDWDMGDWLPDETRIVDVPDKKIGLEKFSRLHRWVVPARVDGVWCGRAGAEGLTLRLSQSFQLFAGTLGRDGREAALSGRLDGARLHTAAQAPVELEARVDGEFLRVVRARGEGMPPPGAHLQRSATGRCTAG